MLETQGYKCDLFADNYSKLKKAYKWNYSINLRLGALLYAMENRAVDTDAINRCRKIIKDNTGVFSQFKDLTNFTVSVMLSLHSEPEGSFKGILNVYNSMKAEGFHATHYLVLAATAITLNVDSMDYDKVIPAAKKHYEAMKEDHRFITSADDYGIAALFAIADLPITQTEREMENCYRILKEDFHGSNAVQALTQVLAFGKEDTANKCRRVRELHNELKKRKCKFGSGLQLSMLGVLALLEQDTSKIADEVVWTAEYLRNKKGLSNWSVSYQDRLILAAALVCGEYLGTDRKNLIEMAISNNVIEILVTQQVAAITASSAAATAAAASSAASS